jgi:hypothetical protein
VCFALICFLRTWSLVLAAVCLGFCHRPEFVDLLISELFWLRFPRETFPLPESFFLVHLCALVRSDGSCSIFVFPLSWRLLGSSFFSTAQSSSLGLGSVFFLATLRGCSVFLAFSIAGAAQGFRSRLVFLLGLSIAWQESAQVCPGLGSLPSLDSNRSRFSLCCW